VGFKGFYERGLIKGRGAILSIGGGAKRTLITTQGYIKDR